jgi:hypothetical protein
MECFNVLAIFNKILRFAGGRIGESRSFKDLGKVSIE